MTACISDTGVNDGRFRNQRVLRDLGGDVRLSDRIENGGALLFNGQTYRLKLGP